MTLSTYFEGDPESCWRVARRLDVLAESLDDTSRFLGHQASLPADDFEGLSGDAYRGSAGRLRDDAVATASAQRAVAVALDELATNLDGVRRVLRRARALARDHLVIAGLEIQPPGPYADERQREVFRMVGGAVHEARRVEHRAHHDWQVALAQHAGTPAPAPIADDPFGLPLPDPVPEPPLEPLPEPRPEPRPDRQPDPRPEPDPPAGSAPPPPTVVPTASSTPTDPPAPVVAQDDWESPPEDDWSAAAPAAPVTITWELSDGPR